MHTLHINQTAELDKTILSNHLLSRSHFWKVGLRSGLLSCTKVVSHPLAPEKSGHIIMRSGLSLGGHFTNESFSAEFTLTGLLNGDRGLFTRGSHGHGWVTEVRNLCEAWLFNISRWHYFHVSVAVQFYISFCTTVGAH